MPLEIRKGEMILFMPLIQQAAMRFCRVRITLLHCTPIGVVNIHFQGRPIYAVPDALYGLIMHHGSTMYVSSRPFIFFISRRLTLFFPYGRTSG